MQQTKLANGINAIKAVIFSFCEQSLHIIRYKMGPIIGIIVKIAQGNFWLDIFTSHF